MAPWQAAGGCCRSSAQLRSPHCVVTRAHPPTHARSQPWFAGVAHDVALCSRAYHAGDKQLRGLQQGGSGSGGERLNFPLSCFVNQPDFWDALSLPFGELAIKLRCGRDLEKVGGGRVA